MKVFLLDLWLDLREKRLAPVALVLLVGVIAVPIVLAKKSEPPPAAPTATTASLAPALPVIAGQASTGPVDSKLQTFSSRDPFEPTATPAAAGGTTTGTSTTPTATTPTTTPGTGTTGSGSTPGGATNGSGPTTGTGTGTTTPETKTTLFTYTTDLKFGAGGAVTTYKDVKRLELIPDEKTPKIVFLGVTTTGKTAVFLIDSNIGVDTGEGTCRPSADECTFLYLRPEKTHDQATLTDSDGTVFHLRLIDINRVTVSSANGNSTTGNSNGNSNSNKNPSQAFTGSAKPKSDSATVPGDTPPGEPSQSSSFQQLFADGAK